MIKINKNKNWKKYDSRRERDTILGIRCTQQEKELFYKLAGLKHMTAVELLIYLVNEEMEREENK